MKHIQYLKSPKSFMSSFNNKSPKNEPKRTISPAGSKQGNNRGVECAKANKPCEGKWKGLM